jgi:predicted dehydrogenase
MGGNHARVIAESGAAALGVVIDADEIRAKELATSFGADWSTDLERAVQCDAAVIATPTKMHVPCAVPLLEAGVPLLVEKPLAESLSDAQTLVDAARSAAVVLMCGFVERFNPVFTTAQNLLEDEPVHVVAVRHSPSAPRMATSVIDDLLIHDIDLAMCVSNDFTIDHVGGTVWTPPGSLRPEIAACTLRLGGGLVASLSASRASQRKTRSLMIDTGTTMIELDLLRQDISVYRNITQEQFVKDAITYRAHTVIDIPFVRHGGEPLALQLAHFVGLLRGGEDPFSDGARLLAPHEVTERLFAMQTPRWVATNP